ncbi:hypothetical protein Tco_0306094 [Tanacetum coccineum]
MANLSNYGSDVISEAPRSKPYHNDMDNQSVHAMQDFEQTPVVDFLEIEIASDSNIISSSSVSAGYIIEFMLEDLEAVPADYVPAGHVLISADKYIIC